MNQHTLLRKQSKGLSPYNGNKSAMQKPNIELISINCVYQLGEALTQPKVTCVHQKQLFFVRRNPKINHQVGRYE